MSGLARRRLSDRSASLEPESAWSDMVVRADTVVEGRYPPWPTLLPFEGACKRMAVYIRGGGLSVDAEWDQVKPKMWEPLALINEGGYLTVDSQDAICTTTQRAYVEGIMRLDHAKVFVARFNMAGDKVALVQTLVEDDAGIPWIPVPVTRRKVDGVWAAKTNCPLFGNLRESVRYRQFEGGFKPKKNERRMEFVNVDCFDPVWGRSALVRDGLLHCMLSALKQ